ncbi:TPM domain-containing protein [Reichenbachiella sp.]|uniref:TPM domain-containing protein n=1 Tax=Reichenbachiella sp. TaxID=2184521 RepID=UPI003298F523
MSRGKYWHLILFFFFVLGGCNNSEKKVTAETVKEEIKFVFDYSFLLNKNEKDSLNDLLNSINNSGQLEFLYCSVSNDEGLNVNLLVENYFDALKPNSDASKRVLILISVKTRDFKIHLSPELAEKISEDELNSISEKLIIDFGVNEFYEGLTSAFLQIHLLLMRPS